ncbi:MAG: hypothetical protein ACKVP0_24365 [Pirellulaceae bacterium]
MKYSLRSLMLAERQIGSSKAIGMAILGLGIAAVGVFFIFTPGKHILQSDRKTGYSLYLQELKSSGDEKRAVATASVFYKMFGWVWIIFGLVVFLGSLISIFSERAP